MNDSRHIVLMGDSIFDNKAYTQGEPDVVAHLQPLLPDGWRTTLLAVDGASTGSMSTQLSRVPPDATHLVLSLGGNDALRNIDLLDTRLDSSRAALLLFDEFNDVIARAALDHAARLIELRSGCDDHADYVDSIEPSGSGGRKIAGHRPGRRGTSWKGGSSGHGGLTENRYRPASTSAADANAVAASCKNRDSIEPSGYRLFIETAGHAPVAAS